MLWKKKLFGTDGMLPLFFQPVFNILDVFFIASVRTDDFFRILLIPKAPRLREWCIRTSTSISVTSNSTATTNTVMKLRAFCPAGCEQVAVMRLRALCLRPGCALSRGRSPVCAWSQLRV